MDGEISGTPLVVSDFHLLPGKSQNKTKYMTVKDNLASLSSKKGVEDSPAPEPVEEDCPRQLFSAFL